QSARLLQPANPTSLQAAPPTTGESHRGRRLQLRYLLVALLLGAAVLTLSSRFRTDIAALMPALQPAAAVTETPMPSADLHDSGVSQAAPAATTSNMQQKPRAGSVSAAEKPARTGSRSLRRAQDPATRLERTVRLEPGR